MARRERSQQAYPETPPGKNLIFTIKPRILRLRRVQ